jgi:CO/xanthine dehydrogenase Mo-binding subunit
MGEFAIGQGVPRFEDPRLVQGRGRYIDDVVYPGENSIDQDRRSQGRTGGD